MLQSSGNHARYIQSVLQGKGSTTPDYVRRSWVRCLSQYRLDPQSQREPYVLAREERLARKERNAELLSFADAEMAHLYHQLAGSGYSIILSDRDGVLLDYYGDLSFRDAACRTGLVPGAVWSEEHGGTNGMGTCLFERAPLIIHRDQHFFSRNTGLTCCAAPIFDHQGQLLAVLDASGESDRAQQHTLVLARLSAQMIESRLFLHRFRDAFIVRFHTRPELSGSSGQGLIALAPPGLITALDRNALLQLGYKDSAELAGSPLERLFNISLPALLERTQKKSFHAVPVYETRHGGRFFALAQAPQSRRPHAAKEPPACAGERAAVVRGRSLLDELDLGDTRMARNIRAARRCESRDIPILLLGESGTGKELFARALHAASDRAERAFIAVNCGSLPAAALQAELFGQAAGGDDERGRIVQAHGGTLFLDDVGELPLELQSQLLHVIEEREVRPPACEASLKVDIRIVSASRSSLKDRVRSGELREDLFYRLQGLVLPLPPLRERQDKLALIRHLFAQETAATPSVTLSEELVETLCACSWPGNIRQLRNVLRGLIALRTSDRLDLDSLPPDYDVELPQARAQGRECSPQVQGLNPLEKAERGALLHELVEHQGNISRVAHNLGIGRNTVYRKMRRLGIPFPRAPATTR